MGVYNLLHTMIHLKPQRNPFVIAILVIIAVLGATAWFMQYTGMFDEVEEVTETSDTFEPQLVHTTTPAEGVQGTVYFTSPTTIIDEESLGYRAEIFRLDLATGEVYQMSNIGSVFDASYVDDERSLLILGTLDATTTQPVTVPFTYNRNTNALTEIPTALSYSGNEIEAAPAGGKIAYAHMYNLATDIETWSDMAEWEIVIHDTTTNNERYIASSTRPLWGPEGDNLFYIHEDGIKRLELSTNSGFKMFTAYAPHVPSDDFAVNPSGDAFVITMPNAGMISVNEINPVDGVIEEVAQINSDSERFYEPTFGASDDTYAVLAVGEESAAIHFYEVGSTEPFETISLDHFDPAFTSLENWVE